MPPGDEYRIKAANMNARAQQETNLRVKAELENLALSYLRLAEQAARNASRHFVTEISLPQSVPQQQQQTQPSRTKDED